MTQAAQLAQYGANNVGLSFKNRIINGDMGIDQRNNGASVSRAANSGDAYQLDRWLTANAADSVYTVQQVSDAPTGFVNSLRITVTTADASLGASQINLIRQSIEGFNMADFAWGTANAQTVTLSFFVKSSLTGQFGGAMTNSAGNRSRPFSYTISAANTWEYKTITIPGDVTGTWLTTNGIGIRLDLNIGTGSSFLNTPGSWYGANLVGATGDTSVVGTNGATWQITGVQLEKGSVATSFDYLPYGTELQLCQRYYAKLQNDGTGGDVQFGFGIQQSTTSGQIYIKYPTTMRAEPTASISSLQITNLRSFSANATLNSISPGFDTANIAVSFSANGFTDAPCSLAIANNTAGFLALSSEL